MSFPSCAAVTSNSPSIAHNFEQIQSVILPRFSSLIQSYKSLWDKVLAREAYFGEEVLAQCTVSGLRQLSALPLVELNQLKQTMHIRLSEFWGNPIEFESVWALCSDAVNQAKPPCKHALYSDTIHLSITYIRTTLYMLLQITYIYLLLQHFYVHAYSIQGICTT